MSSIIKTCNQPGHTESSTPGMKQAKPAEGEWLEHHSKSIFKLWLKWRTPLGISYQYLERVKQELSEYYKEPLKQEFIEATYQ